MASHFFDIHDARITRADDPLDRSAERRYRLVTEEDLREHHRVVNSVFYGYSAERLAEWCCVEVETARRWKRAEASPSPQAQRLFELHRDWHVMSSPAWAGWRVKGDVLVDPEGNETTQGQLRAYSLVYQLARELMRDNEAAKARFQEIMREVG